MKPCFLIVCLCLLTACSPKNTVFYSKVDQCTSMHRQMAYNRQNRNQEAHNLTHSQKAKFAATYEELGCNAKNNTAMKTEDKQPA